MINYEKIIIIIIIVERRNEQTKEDVGLHFHNPDFLPSWRVLATFLESGSKERRGGGKDRRDKEGGRESNFGGVGTKRERDAFRHRGRWVTSAYREQVERRCGSFSRHRGQPRPARRGQQREVEVRFGALGVATSRIEQSRVESIHGDRNTLEKIDPFRATDRKLTLLHGVRVDQRLLERVRG